MYYLSNKDIASMSPRRGIQITNQANQLAFRSGFSLDIIRLVIRIIATGIGLTSRSGLARALRIHDLDIMSILAIDNSRDVEVVQAVPAVPADLAEHAGHVFVAVAHRVPVADPAFGEFNGFGLTAFEALGLHGPRAFLGCEDDVATGAVLGDHVDGAGADEGGDGGGEECGGEMHGVVGGLVWFLKKVI